MLAYLLILIDICPINCCTALPPHLSVARQQIEQSLCDLSFGEKQVEQFICDRPDTSKIIQRERVLRLTLIWYFAGELKGHRVYWDSREPIGPQPAEHLPAMLGYPSIVRVSKNKVSSIDQCACLCDSPPLSDSGGACVYAAITGA